jgi:hypothetical protein
MWCSELQQAWIYTGSGWHSRDCLGRDIEGSSGSPSEMAVIVQVGGEMSSRARKEDVLENCLKNKTIGYGGSSL